MTWRGYRLLLIVIVGTLVLVVLVPRLVPFKARWEVLPQERFNDFVEEQYRQELLPRNATLVFLRDRITRREYVVMCGQQDFVAQGFGHRAEWFRDVISAKYIQCVGDVAYVELFEGLEDFDETPYEPRP